MGFEYLHIQRPWVPHPSCELCVISVRVIRVRMDKNAD